MSTNVGPRMLRNLTPCKTFMRLMRPYKDHPTLDLRRRWCWFEDFRRSPEACGSDTGGLISSIIRFDGFFGSCVRTLRGRITNFPDPKVTASRSQLCRSPGQPTLIVIFSAMLTSRHSDHQHKCRKSCAKSLSHSDSSDYACAPNSQWPEG